MRAHTIQSSSAAKRCRLRKVLRRCGDLLTGALYAGLFVYTWLAFFRFI